MRAWERASVRPHSRAYSDKRLLLGELAHPAEPAVLENANIEIDPQRLVRRPAEKNVARGLHHPLTLDHAPALRALIGKLRRQPLEDRALRLLDLQEERLAVAVEEQPDDTDRADGADAHGLESDVGQSIAIEQNRPVRSERFAIKLEPASKIDLAARRASSG